MSHERVSDGLWAELQQKFDDGTPRGLVWPMIATMLVGVATTASTPEEVAKANEALAAAIYAADHYAVQEMEIQACVDQLRAYVDRPQEDR